VGGNVGARVGERDEIYNAVNSLQWTLTLFLRTLYNNTVFGFSLLSVNVAGGDNPGFAEADFPWLIYCTRKKEKKERERDKK